MKRVKKYFYNTDTNSFEKLVVPLRTRLLRFLGFISSALVTALIMVAVALQFLDTPKEKLMRKEVLTISERYDLLEQQVNDLNKQLADLESRDNNIYRAVFASAPLPDTIRHGKKYSDTKKLKYIGTDDILDKVVADVQLLSNRIHTQKLSYDTLEQMVRSKEKMLACIPAIQPISNKNLTHVASGFGYRIDPIYKMPKMHTGLDFAAAIGTPIYATADGKVEESGFDNSGYGEYVLIDHGYGYETLYGHMVRIKAKSGEKVKRGQVIGWVGNSGKSTGAHCHYEVIRNSEKIDPVHYFFNDLSPTEYERMVRMAASTNQAFD
ncbi:MAG: M23 family metallopeptidase [Bacteroidota bacterium]